MLGCQQGEVVKILEVRPGCTTVLVAVGGRIEKAVNYDYLTGSVHPGDAVLLNVTAVRLGLGTGGYHFVMANLDTAQIVNREKGHIIKMRYTPLQTQVLAAEEEASPYHRFFGPEAFLDQTPVVVVALHSMIAAVTAAVKAQRGPSCRVIYVMTDGAALPLWFSRLVGELQEHRLLDGTVTSGQALGGDVEAVNVYSGLLAARYVLGADVIVAGMGPGIAGTGTAWGHTGLEQGELVNAVDILGGRPVAVARLSFADPRTRHRGLSHHTLTALGRVALRPAFIGLPPLAGAALELVQHQITMAGLEEKHILLLADGREGVNYLRRTIGDVTTMGRGIDADPYFFQAAAAGGAVAADLLGLGEVELHHFPDGRVIPGEMVQRGEQVFHFAPPEKTGRSEGGFPLHDEHLQ